MERSSVLGTAKKSFDALGLSQINNLRNTSPNDVDGIVFSTTEAMDLFFSTRDLLNSKGLLTTDSVVWLTFILSVAVPSEFPIYDQNVRRIFRLFVRCWGKAKTESELVELVRAEVSEHQLLVDRRRLHKREIRSSGKNCNCDLCKGCCELCVTTPMNMPYKIGLNGEVQDFTQATNFLRVATEYFVFRTWMLSLAEGIRSIRNEPDRESVKLSRRPDMAVLAFGKFIRDGKPNCTGEID